MDTLKKIKKAMTANNVTSIRVTYSGAGDSGSIDECSAYRGDTIITDDSIVGRIESLAYDLIDENHPGYELDEGGSGSIDFLLEKGRLDMGYTKKYMVLTTDYIKKVI